MGVKEVSPEDGFGDVGDNKCPGAGFSVVVNVNRFGFVARYFRTIGSSDVRAIGFCTRFCVSSG